MIIVRTKKTLALLRHLREAIEGDEIDTWAEDAEGDFTHDAPQWRNKAWFHAVRYNADRVEFRIVCTRNRPLSRVEYALYHGRFIEMLINHCVRYIDNIECTPTAIEGKDRVTPRNLNRRENEE